MALAIFIGAATTVLTPVAEAQQGTRDASLRAYYSANGLLNRGMHDLAIEEYRAFLDAYPDHEFADTARYGLGVCLYRTDRHAEAIAALSEVRSGEDFQFAAEVQAILGQCHLAGKSYESAAQCFDRVIERHADHELADDATALLAESLYNIGDHRSTRDAAKALRERWPQSPHRDRSDLFDALAAMAMGEYGEGAAVLEALVKRSPDGPYIAQAELLLAQCHHHNNAINRAMRRYRDVIRRGAKEHTPAAMHGLSLLLHEEQELDEASELLTTLITTFPNHPLIASAWLNQGRVLFDQQEYDAARASFEQAAKRSEEQADRAIYWLAKCDLRTGREGAAAARLEQAIAQYPESPVLAEMMYDRGVALLRSGERAKAVQALDAFRDRFPRREEAPVAQHLAASIEHQNGAYEASAERCRDFQRAYGDHERRADVDFLLAENQFLSREYDQSIQSFTAFHDAHPADDRNDRAAYRVGLAYFHLGRSDDALPVLQSVLERHSDDPAFVFGQYALGDMHFEAGRLAEAVERFTGFLAIDEGDAVADDALLKLGLARQRLDQPDKALDSFDALIERYPDSDHLAHARFERGQALVALGRHEEAAQSFEELLEEAPDSRFAPYALNHLASMALADQRYDDAAEAYGRIAAMDDASDLHADAIFHQAQSLMKAKHYADAVEGFSRFLDSYDEHTRVPQAAAYRAVSMARLEQNAEAARELERVAQAHGSALDTSLHASVLYELAWAHRKLDDRDKAAGAYEQLLAIEADDALRQHGMAELAELAADAGEYARAIQLIDELRSAQSTSMHPLPDSVMEQSIYRYGVCHHRLKRYAPAAGIFEAFIGTYPESELLASACMLAGDASFQIGQHRRSIDHLTRVVEEFADTDLLGPSLLRLGESAAALQDWSTSRTAYARFLKAFPQDPMWFQAQFGVGWALENSGKYDEAVAAYQLVVNGHEGQTAARAQFQIGECLFAQKLHKAAVRELLKVDIHYAYPEWSAAALYEAGRCFQAMGNPVDARTQYQQVQERYADSKWAQLATTRLEELKRTTLPGHGSDAR